ncbi:MAG: LysR family transcriptional regulator [Alphaproteobacteria bacterium]|nr:LysR family transcriptional regulator [Alphaproteobacteria bacterium]
MNIQAIRLFLHVMQRGSLAAGAQQLNMSASAASRLLAGLERTTGLKLFSRDGHSLRPTSEGAQYFNECNRVLIAVDELPRAARRLASGARSRLRLACGSRLANSLMIPAIGRFVKKNPDVEIDFHLAQIQDIDRIISDRFDIAVGALLPVMLPAVVAAPLLELPTVAVMRRDHALAGRPFVRAADIAAHRLIATTIGPMRTDLEHMFHSEGVELRPQYTANSIDHGCHMVLQADAVMVTDPLVPLAIDAGLFAMVPVKPFRMMQTSIFTPVLKAESRLIAEFKFALREEAKAIEKRVARLLGNPGTARRARRGPAKKKAR